MVLKSHCDNCDAVVGDANPSRLVNIQPWGYRCVVSVSICKEENQVLCADCLRAAVVAFAESLSTTVFVEPPSVDAGDPSAADPGTPTPRD